MRRVLAVAFLFALATACEVSSDAGGDPPPPEAKIPTPRLVSQSLRESKQELSSVNLHISFTKEFSRRRPGTVLRQVPASGEEIAPGLTVIVVVAKPPPIVRPVTFETLSRARNLLKAQGYEVRVVRRIDPLGEIFGVGAVLDYRPSGRVMPGRTITLVVAKKQPTNDCHSSYTDGCVPIASDVDCGGGSGNGPAYVWESVTVVGPDVYDLDGDGDGVGCE